VTNLPRLLPGVQPRPTAEVVTVAGGGTYDPRPEGDGSEHEEEVGRAFDRDRETHWRTTSYKTRDFGLLKPGVGIWFDAGRPVSLQEIRVVSMAGGWQGTIRTSDDKLTWSEAGPSQTVGPEHAFPTFGSGEHRYWMVWITRLTATPGAASGGNPFGVGIREIEPIAG
jgi:putative peptidoglycan lipid II flippase